MLSGGAIIEDGTAHEVLTRPRNPITARFLNAMGARPSAAGVRPSFHHVRPAPPLSEITRTPMRHHSLSVSPATVHWGYFSKAVAPALAVRSGDRATIETLTHHAADDWSA